MAALGDGLELFMTAMDGDWRVDRYEVDEETGKLRIHYVSLKVPWVVWSHLPFGELARMPVIGTVGRIGFIGGPGGANFGVEERG